jgi:hypothetical protein
MSSKYDLESLVPYAIEVMEADDEHQWAVLKCQCDLSDVEDALIAETVNLVRRSYGEEAIITDVQQLMADDLLLGTFNLEHLVAAVRMGMPDPDAEGDKPKHLTNYRSQAAEMIAKLTLAHVFGFQYPVAAQEASGNPNQPILGFDGWGIWKSEDGHFTLVLIQVKATDDSKRPPGEARKLIKECKSIPKSPSLIARALSTMVRLLESVDNETLKKALVLMLHGLGEHKQLPTIFVAPTIVRGNVAADIKDLKSIRAAAPDYAPAIARGVSVSLGVTLEDFGRTVMESARAAV